jgi:hypothetical protein
MHLYEDGDKVLERSQVEDMNVAFGLRAEQEKSRNNISKKKKNRI